MSSTWATFLFETANFLLLAAVLGWLFFRPVRAALERRRSELEREGRVAAEARAEAERAVQAAHAKRAELEGTLAALRERVQAEAERERERLLEAARAQIQRERETLKGELVSQRRAQARSLVRDAAFAARAIVEQLLGEIGGPDLERALLRGACSEVETLGSSGRLTSVIVESARPLEAEAVADLARAAGITPAEVARRVDPELVGGLRVLTDGGLVDASVAGIASQAERVLVKQLEKEDPKHG